MGKGGQIVGGILLFVVGSIILTVILNPELLVAPPSDLRQIELETFNRINQERSDRGLPVLANDTNLCLVAREWSESMLSEDKLGHGNFDARMKTIGYMNKYECGEVIAMCSGHRTGIPDIFVKGWLSSTGHREIMLTPKHGKMGVGVARDGDTYYATVDFIFYD